MINDPKFECPNCGSTDFRVSSVPKTFEDFLGAPCAKCGVPLTEEEIKKQALAIAQKALKDSLGALL